MRHDRRVSAAEEPEPIRIPADEESAVYANDFEVWTTRFDVALDLRALGPLEEGERAAYPLLRVRVPVAMLTPMCFALIDALERFESNGGGA